MGKKIRWIVMAAALLVFLGSGGAVLMVHGQYQQSRRGYASAADAYTSQVVANSFSSENASLADGSADSAETSHESENQRIAPIAVDFASLQAEAPDVIGWLYCPDTVIDYPVVQGSDNDFYLHHNYRGDADQSGSIFVDAQCAPGFAGPNTIIYGHSMKDGSMFGELEKWEDQAYYQAHPVLWLLTPEGDYRVQLFSGYTTEATSDTYTVFSGPSEDFTQYLIQCQAQSDFSSDVVLDRDGRYVILSTCAYDFDGARHVLHGMLEPVAAQ